MAALKPMLPTQQVTCISGAANIHCRYDFRRRNESLQKWGVQTEGVEVVKDKKSFFWSGNIILI
ncbi:MAG: hypothetical protein IPH28_08700 [Cytophagaceae bacterium]|nr:hypothetical protein [Cytophagaceae bacterium]